MPRSTLAAPRTPLKLAATTSTLPSRFTSPAAEPRGWTPTLGVDAAAKPPVGEAIEGLFQERLEAEAHHFFEVGDFPRAASYAERAAEAAARMFANREALRLLELAITAHTRGALDPSGLPRLRELRGEVERRGAVEG